MFFIKLLSRLPFRFLYLISDLLFFITYYLVGYRRAIVKKNLQHAFPEKDKVQLLKIEKQFYRNLADISLETIKMLTISGEDLAKRVVYMNSPDKIVGIDKPIILMTSHLCNWELLWVSLTEQFSGHFTMHAVYQRLRNDFFNRLMLLLRSRFGGIMHEKNVIVSDLSKLTDHYFILGMVSDQRPSSGERKYWAKFMHRDAAFYSGSEVIARRMDLAVVYISMKRIRRGYFEVSFELITRHPKQMERNEITNIFIQLMERDIRRDPSAYLWSHDRWKHKKSIE